MMHDSISTFTQVLKTQAVSLGFSTIGISSVEPLEREGKQLKDWLSNGYHGSMQWLGQNVDRRLNPILVFSESQSVIIVAMNYWTGDHQPENPQYGRISRYAWGMDYHCVLREKLTQLLQWMQQQDSSIRGKIYVDSGPLLEKAWAVRSGLGWRGKNTVIISKNQGSYLFLGVILSNIPLVYDQLIPDYCGTCTRCIDACPTGAIVAPYILDASKCISYLTVEHRGEIPNNYHAALGNWIFGCDICQEVCPWNRFTQKTNVKEFYPKNGLLSTLLSQWSNLTEEEFKIRFMNSPIARTKYRGFIRNSTIALENAKHNHSILLGFNT